MSYQESKAFSQDFRLVVPTDETPGCTISNLHFEYERDACGIGVSRPRLSWSVDTAIADWHQAGYEIEAYDLSGHLCDQTGRVASDQSLFVAWPFASLDSR